MVAKRINQRDLLPLGTQPRHYGEIVKVSNTVSDSVTLAAGEDRVFTVTAESPLGQVLKVMPEISLWETSIVATNWLPGGSAVDESDYQIIGLWLDQNSGDGKNAVAKIYVRNATNATTTFTVRIAAGTEDGHKITGSAWTTAGNLLLGKTGASSLSIRVAASLDDGDKPDTGWTAIGNALRFGSDSFDVIIVAMRFNNITIPQGTTINSATIDVNPNANDAANLNTRIYGIDEDDTANFSADPTGRTQTTASVAWNINGVTQDVVVTSPSLTTIVQEIVDRAGWASGNDMGFIVRDETAMNTSNIEFDSYDGSSSQAPLLNINYGTPATITGGVRFPSVTIPQGATIASAKITFTATATDSDTINTKIYGVDEDDTASFSSDPTGRTKTTASADWDRVGTTAEAEYDTSALTTIVQEIVDRVGWASGNDMGFLIEDDGTANGHQLSFYGYDNSTTKAALLTIVYSTPESKTVIFRGRIRYIVPIQDVIIQ